MPPQVSLPDEGDLVWMDFTPHAGHEQAGRRPALVLTPKRYHERCNYAFVCPITSNLKPYAYKVALPANLPATGVVLVDQAKSVDRIARNLVVIGSVPDEFLDDIRSRLVSLSMPGILTKPSA